MRCAKCRNEAVFFQSYSGRHLCGRHLIQDIEARAKRTIRSHRWMHHGDHIAVVVSGDRKSAALLIFLQKLTADRRDIRLSAVPACTGDGETGEVSVAATLAESLGIPCIEMPLPGGSLTAANGNVTKIALAISLDDIGEGVLAEFLAGNADRLVHPPQGLIGPLPVICPFIAIPADEMEIYGEIGAAGFSFPTTSAGNRIAPETAALFRDYCQRHPATKHALLHLAEQLSGGDITTTVAGCAVGRETMDSVSLPQQERPNS